MNNLWNLADAPVGEDFALRVYTSRLLGLDRSLVLHGGGNTSVKTRMPDRYGEKRDVLWVKASGYDLATMGAEGFTALELTPVLRLGQLDALGDGEMVRELRRARLDPDAATPSIEAIVHALIPFRFVDHTHADAVLTISNTPDGRARLEAVYGPETRILPYVKPGFDLALQLRTLVRDGTIERCKVLVLEHHGVFTFSDDACESYETMIAAVGKAEDYLRSATQPVALSNGYGPALAIARARRAASEVAGRALVSRPGPSIPAEHVSRILELSRHGTVTPEHVVHNKPFPAGLTIEQPEAGMQRFSEEYRDYFERARGETLVMLPSYPHWALFDDGTSRSFGPNLKRAVISTDVVDVTLRALLAADQMGGWRGLDEVDLRGLEYWELEQAKLRRQPAAPPLSGKIALVCGSASGIGLATARTLHRVGAAVVGLDVDPDVSTAMPSTGFEGRVVDLRDEAATAAAVEDVVRSYGGIDILVLNAGIFQTGVRIEAMEAEDWNRTLSINLSAHCLALKHAIPFLRLGVAPSVVFVGSRNVSAPGPGAAAYSVSKAGLTQLMRVAALELACDGITVNAVHPDSVFDTRLWSPEALATSAARYGLSIDEYKTRNLLKKEIRSADVAAAVLALADGTLACTTGAQLPVDGGNDRVI